MQAEITGTVRSVDGTPVPGALVALGGSSPRHPDIAIVTDAEGRYRFTGLTPGVYTVQANAAGHPQGTAEVEVRQGEPAELDVHLR
jgi:hypothetical protein